MNGIFITFEGIEGCGKSSQATRLKSNLEAMGLKCLLTREPGGTRIGKDIRQIILHSEDITPMSELLLFLADRNLHINQLIRPALKQGTIVICDRFYDSTFAYQVSGRKIDISIVRQLNDYAIEGLHPDITFLIDVPTEVGFQRKKNAEFELDRIENEDMEFHESVRNAYLELARDSERIVIIDGTESIEAIEEKVFGIVKARFTMCI